MCEKLIHVHPPKQNWDEVHKNNEYLIGILSTNTGPDYWKGGARELGGMSHVHVYRMFCLGPCERSQI